jgi:hypothetical protein
MKDMVKSGSFYRKQEPYFTLESITRSKLANFGVLQERLIRFVNGRIQNGDFTERGLARLIGISQPQVHNVLKGARKLRPEVADRLIAKFEMCVLDLLEPSELRQYLDLRFAPHGNPIGESDGSIGSHLAPKRFAERPIPRKPPAREKFWSMPEEQAV